MDAQSCVWAVTLRVSEMTWNKEISLNRVGKNDHSDDEINIDDLVRTKDFYTLGKKDVRRVQGAHMYVDISNFHDAVENAGDDKDKQKKLLRAASVLRKGQAEIFDENEVGQIQLQSARQHALCFKPYDSEEETKEAERAKRAVIAAITQHSYLYESFNPVFKDDVGNFEAATGIDAGKSHVTNIGYKGERELISIGTCANMGAKVIDQSKNNSITITKDVYDLLPDCLKKHFSQSRTVSKTITYQATGLLWGSYPELADDLSVSFDAEKLKKKVEERKGELALSDMRITEAEVLIDIDTLAEKNSKRTSAVAIYADLDGFTKYVQESESDDEKIKSLVRKLHMIRHEFHSVMKKDYNGLVIQHQGDCIVGIMHLPSGDNFDKRCNAGLDIAIGLQSSMEHVLNEKLGDTKEIHVGIGLDVGKNLVTRLGKKGEREVIVLGKKVSSAERLQRATSGKKIHISKALYDVIANETKKGEFKKTSDDNYVATNLTFPRLDELEEEKAAKLDTIGAKAINGRIAIITSKVGERAVSNTRPWLSLYPTQIPVRNVLGKELNKVLLKRWEIEQEIAHEFMTDVVVGFYEQGRAYISGTFQLVSNHGHVYDTFKLRIVYPGDFPSKSRVPYVFLDSHRNKWENSADAHLFTNWAMCLFVPGESPIDFTSETSLQELFVVVRVFLFKERLYQRDLILQAISGNRAIWPGEARSHGIAGIVEAINARGGMRKHEFCICGSGKKFKQCCKSKISK
jgi:class 3 adenylate cyclase